MNDKLTQYIRAGYPGIYVISPEEQRIEAEFQRIAGELEFQLHAWTATTGLIDVKAGTVRPCNDPMEALLALMDLPEKSILLLKDFHVFLANDPNPILARQVKDVLLHAKTSNKVMVISGCRLCLPPELERELVIVDFALPGKQGLGQVMDGIMESAGLTAPSEQLRESILDAATGLTTVEAENAFALSVVETQQIDPQVIAREKAHTVKKNGILEIIESNESLDSIGGLDLLKSWLLQRRNALTQRARAYGLPIPKGLLIVGIPGTGKSLTAKATARVFERPLLKLDAGRIFGGIVGQSESNLRSAIQTAEAIAPCILWIDELEKAFGATRSSGVSDGGTSGRVFGSFISWLQEKTAPVFVVATANDVSQLPPELLRKGRFDELFFVDLPSQVERQDIWTIQIARFGRDPGDYDLVQLARMTEGLTGSEIEAVYSDALFLAFESDAEPTDLTIAEVLNGFVPLSKLMAEPIAALRNWAMGRARLATSQPPEKKLRRLAA